MSGNIIKPARLELIYEHGHALASVFPLLASAVTVTKAAGAWGAFPTPTEIIPAISSPQSNMFDIHWIILSSISANGDYVLQLYKGAALSEILLTSCAFLRTTNKTVGAVPVLTKRINPNTRISAAISSENATGDSCAIKLVYHKY